MKKEAAIIAAMNVAAFAAIFGAKATSTQAATTGEIPAAIQEAAEKYGEQYGISPELLESIAFQESTFRPWVQNGACAGLMQVNPEFHRERMERLGVTDLYDPDQNMEVAADYLLELFEEYEEVTLVLDVYNGNSRAESIYDSGKLSPYAREVTERAKQYEEAHGK